MDICTEKSCSYELEAVIAFCFHKCWFYICSNFCQRVRIYIQRTIFFVVYTLLLVYDILIETYFCFSCLTCFYPVNGSFYFSAIRRIATLCCWIISTVYNTYSSIFISFISCTGYKICVHKTNLCAREHSLIFLRRIYHEVFSLNIEFSAKRYFTGSQFFVLHIIRSFQIFHFAFRIIIDHKLDRIKNSHQTGTFQFQILTDAVFKHCIVNRAVCFGYTTEFYKHFDGFRCKSTAAQCCDGNQTRIIPSVYNAFLYQFLDITFTCNYICQIQFCKLNLLRWLWVFQFFYNPVIQWSVILKLQSTDGMCDSLNRILDGMGEIIHWIDAPCITCSVVSHMSNTIDNRVAHIHVRRCHIDLGTKHFLSVCIFAFFHLFKKLQVLFYASVSVWTFFTRLCKSSTIFTDLICCQVTYIGFAFLDQLYSSFIHLSEIVRCKKQSVFPVCTKPFDICLDGFYKLTLFFGRVCIIKTHVELTVIFLCKTIV